MHSFYSIIPCGICWQSLFELPSTVTVVLPLFNVTNLPVPVSSSSFVLWWSTHVQMFPPERSKKHGDPRWSIVTLDNEPRWSMNPRWKSLALRNLIQDNKTRYCILLHSSFSCCIYLQYLHGYAYSLLIAYSYSQIIMYD